MLTVATGHEMFSRSRLNQEEELVKVIVMHVAAYIYRHDQRWEICIPKRVDDLEDKGTLDFCC